MGRVAMVSILVSRAGLAQAEAHGRRGLVGGMVGDGGLRCRVRRAAAWESGGLGLGG